MKHLITFNESVKMSEEERVKLFGVDPEHFKMIFNDMTDRGLDIWIGKAIYNANEKTYYNPPLFTDEYTITVSFKFQKRDDFDNSGYKILDDMYEALSRLDNETDADTKLYYNTDNSFKLVKTVKVDDPIKSNVVTFIENDRYWVMEKIGEYLDVNFDDVYRHLFKMYDNGVYHGSYTIEEPDTMWGDTILGMSFQVWRNDNGVDILSKLMKHRTVAFNTDDEKSNIHHFYPVWQALVYILEGLNDGKEFEDILNAGVKSGVKSGMENAFNGSGEYEIKLNGDMKVILEIDFDNEKQYTSEVDTVKKRIGRLVGFGKEPETWTIYQCEIKVKRSGF